jgi:hypothetical protein
LPGKRDIDRITVTVGRFAVGDYFDGNSYAKDPRADFMNWAMWASAAYDFPADLPGFTRGAVVELNRKDWAIRAGLFQVPSAPNSDVLTFKSGGAVVEFEERHTIFSQPGKLRVGVFANKGNTANYRDVLGISAINPGLDINDIVLGERRERTKYGFYVNAEQQIATDVGIFARASWNDGQNEILSFTDVDRSVSGGVSIKGSYWGRPTDTIGLGGAINGLSGAHRDFLAAGGKGLLIGDGRLNYGNERIFETYYALALNKAFTFTADYQLIANPAYNGDRGPVSIFSGRLHGSSSPPLVCSGGRDGWWRMRHSFKGRERLRLRKSPGMEARIVAIAFEQLAGTKLGIEPRKGQHLGCRDAMRKMDRLDFLRMAEAGCRNQFGQRMKCRMVIVVDARGLVRNNQCAVAREILCRHAGRTAVGMAAERLNAAEREHEAPRRIAPVGAERHGARNIEAGRNLTRGTDADAVARIDADQRVMHEVDALAHRHPEMIHEFSRRCAGAAFLAIHHDEIRIDTGLQHGLADRQKLPAMPDAQLEAHRLPAGQSPHLANELHHLDRG